MLCVHDEVGRRRMETLRSLSEYWQSLHSEGPGQSNFTTPPGMYGVRLFVCLFSSFINRVFAFSLPLFVCNKTLCPVVDNYFELEISV